jgi:uncharacterized membrane protein YdjX (TVP38/TMEM64 family)
MIRTLKLGFTLLWVALLAGAGVAWFHSGLELEQVPERLHDWLEQFGLARAAVTYIVLYALRPLVFFPATVLTVASGLVFGPWLGIVFTIIGENASANVAFALARWLGRDWIRGRETVGLRVWDERIRDNALMSVLMMRLIYLPFDAVNYGCGLTRMRQLDFFVGTFVGIIPAVVAFVLLGGSGAVGVRNRPVLFGAAVAAFLLGLVLARALRRRAPRPPDPRGASDL